MFIGHFAVGFASKRVAPKAGLGPLLAAPLLLDLLFPIFLILGWERASIVPGITAMNPLNLEHLPISHSLVTSLGWGVLFGALYWWRTRYARGALVIAAGVLSHWVLDFVTHIPDLPLWPGGPKVGLGLWNSIAGTVVVEGIMFGAAVWLYTTSTRARDRTGRFAWWSLVAFLVFLYVSMSSTPPPSVDAMGWVGLSAWLFPLWAWWLDRHREALVT